MSTQPSKEPTKPPFVILFRHVAWMCLACGWIFTVAAAIGYHPADWPTHVVAPQQWPVANWCGPAGAWLAYHGYWTLGPGLWLLLVMVGLYLITTARGREVDQVVLRAVGAVMMAVAASGLLSMWMPNSNTMPEGPGGLAAIYLINKIQGHFGEVGTLVVLMMMLGVGAVVAVDQLVIAAPGGVARLIGHLVRQRWARAAAAALHPIAWFRRRPALAAVDAMRSGTLARPAETDADHLDDDELEADADIYEEEDEEVPETDDDEQAVTLDEDEDAEYEEEDDEELIEAEADEGEEIEDPDLPEEQTSTPAERKGVNLDALRARIKNLPITIAAAKKATTPPPAPPPDFSGYQFPTSDLLLDPESGFTEEVAQLVRDQAEVLERALQTYRIDAEVVAIDAGPVITLYEVALAPGTKVSQINAISSDIARELKAQNIRIVPNTAGKSTVGIEVPNLKKEKVRLKELMSLGANAWQKMSLPMFLGKDASGTPLTADLATMPHMLIAGTTGSGKSVCINTIIISWLFCRRPDELKVILVDPKMVELSQFKHIPHLMCPVVTEMSKAAAILEWAVTKMDERYELLAEAGVRDIDTYNNLGWEELCERFDPQTEAEEAKIPKKLPRIVFIIDELADLICTHKEVEGFIVRIAQKARAVGIHLILATQRPQANVVTGLIKSNMPCRVSFKVSSGMDSRIVLDAKGAELLLGQGDMLYLSPRTSKLTRAQGTLVDDVEIRRTVKFLKEVAEPSFEPQLVQLRSSSEGGSEGETVERDPLFEDAVSIVLESQRGSVSLLQRRLAVGYSRASRLIEEMAEAGIIGAYKGSQAREVLMSLEEWEALKAEAARQAADDVETDDSDDEEEAYDDDEAAEWDEEEEYEEDDDDEGEYEEDEEEEED